MRMPDSVVAFLSELAEKRSSFLEVERPRPESVALFCLHSCNHPLESGVSSPRWTHLRRTLHPNPIQIEIITNESREMISLVELISTELHSPPLCGRVYCYVGRHDQRTPNVEEGVQASRLDCPRLYCLGPRKTLYSVGHARVDTARSLPPASCAVRTVDGGCCTVVDRSQNVSRAV